MNNFEKKLDKLTDLIVEAMGISESLLNDSKEKLNEHPFTSDQNLEVISALADIAKLHGALRDAELKTICRSHLIRALGN
jgi:hypothetical protein